MKSDSSGSDGRTWLEVLHALEGVDHADVDGLVLVAGGDQKYLSVGRLNSKK